MTAKELFEPIKEDLQITWVNQTTDKTLLRDINAGVHYLERLCGKKLEFGENTSERPLLTEYVRYKRAAAFDDFSKNYQCELIALQNEKGLEDYVRAKKKNTNI